jgi:hypothetical protein
VVADCNATIPLPQVVGARKLSAYEGSFWRYLCIVITMNLRDCGGFRTLNPGFYHSQMTTTFPPMPVSHKVREHKPAVCANLLVKSSLAIGCLVKLGELGAIPAAEERLLSLLEPVETCYYAPRR